MTDTITDTATPAPEAKVFRYEMPEFGERNKRIVLLGRTERAIVAVQSVRKGGENNLHHHQYLDGFWFVLGGRVRFYTTDDEVVGELGRHEGILVPHGYPYWFESVGDEPLEIMQLEVSAADTKVDLLNDRVDIAPRTQVMAKAEPGSPGL